MQSIFDLTGKVAVVTGATRGMGLAMAQALGRAGASLVVSGRSAESVAQVHSALDKEGLSVRSLIMDVTIPSSVETFASAAESAFGKIDILVLNAAANTATGSILTHTPQQLDEVMSANVRANLVLVNALAPQMIERKDGSIIFTSSIAAKRGNLFLGLYAMSKAAVDQYVRNLALELGPSNINVNSIGPGLVRTEFSRVVWEDPEKEAKMKASNPMRRIGVPDDVAGIAVLLASPAGRFINGQSIGVDGGLTA